MPSPIPPPPPTDASKTLDPDTSTSSPLPNRNLLLKALTTAKLPKSQKRTDQVFRPCHMFFYGSLMDPEVLQTILNLPEPPVTRPATISGFRVKMWSIYPTLVPGDGKVEGVVWEVKDEDHFKRLQRYETDAYEWVWCEAVLDDGKTVIEKCRTFCWAGEVDSKELEEGSFDLERYKKYFKPSVLRRRAPES